MKHCLVGYLVFTAVSSTMLSGCGGGTNYYQTPPLYFGSSHFVPETDSSKSFTGNIAFVNPNAGELKVQYRFNKNFLGGLCYQGNFAKYSEYSNNDILYRFNTNSFDIYWGGSKYQGNQRLFVTAGYGWGANTSIVPEYDYSTEFVYKGNFKRFAIIPGIDLAPGEITNLSLSWRQSFTQFEKYELPDTTYHNKGQFLSDIMLRFSVKGKNTAMNIFLGYFLNGHGGTNRQYDPTPDQWKIERFFAGIGISYRFGNR
jgi:hypothetical protein